MNDKLTIKFPGNGSGKYPQHRQALPAGLPTGKKDLLPLIWSWYLFVKERADEDGQTILKLARTVDGLRRRTEAVEKRLTALSAIVRRDEPVVLFSCISCGHSFEIRKGEAEALELAAICPKCFAWALPGNVGKVYTTKQAAAELGVSDTWIKRHALEEELGQKWDGGNGSGYSFYFTEEELGKLRQYMINAKRFTDPKKPEESVPTGAFRSCYQVREELHVSNEWLRRTVREQGLGRLKARRDSRHPLYFSDEEVEKLRELHAAIKMGRPKIDRKQQVG